MSSTFLHSISSEKHNELFLELWSEENEFNQNLIRSGEFSGLKCSGNYPTLRNAVIKHCIFTDCDFRYSTFNRIEFTCCTFIGCNFCGASFQQTHFVGCEFSNCDFSYTQLECSTLTIDYVMQGSEYGLNLTELVSISSYIQSAALNRCFVYLDEDCETKHFLAPDGILQIGPIGSRSDILTAYILATGEIRLSTGCQKLISIETFVARMNRNLFYANSGEGNPYQHYFDEYMAALSLIKTAALSRSAKEI